MMWKSIAGATVMGLLLTAPAKAALDAPTLYEQAEQAGTYMTFLSAVNAARLAGALTGDESLPATRAK